MIDTFIEAMNVVGLAAALATRSEPIPASFDVGSDTYPCTVLAATSRGKALTVRIGLANEDVAR